MLTFWPLFNSLMTVMFTNMKKYLLLALLSTFSLFSFASHAADYQEGEQYIKLKNKVPNAPTVVEFFSFYCPPCNQFANTYKVSEAVNEHLPQNDKVVKYHVSAMGSMGEELTEAWSVAIALGVENKVEKPLFDAVQKEQSIKNKEDIRQVFIKAGIPAEEYDGALHSFMVKSITAKQQNATEAFGVRGTPSFYVDGQYQIKNDGMQSKTIEGYRTEFADVVKFLIDQNK